MAAERIDPDATQRLDDAALGATLAAGQRVFSRYVLEGEIGRGGMGVVWRARDETLGETIALKFLPASVARDAVSVDELKEETRKARRLRHPNIVSVFDFVQDASMVAVSMELVDGTTLAQLRLQQPGKVFSEKTLVPFMPQICSALDYAHHDAKVAHRDLKPANILVTRDGTAKLADFGIARSLTETHTRLTGKAGTSGTLLYMSPQQLRGHRTTPADDLYALGATLYELLAGKPPFFSGELTHQILHEPPELLSIRRGALAPEAPPVPRAWVETITACLAKEQKDRPHSAGEVAARLRGERGQVNRATPGRRAMWVGIAAAGVVLTVLVAVFWPKGDSVKPNPVGPALVAGPKNRSDLGANVAPRAAPDPKSADGAATSASPTTNLLPPVPVVFAHEFVVTVDPADAGAHVWLGPQSDLVVPADGRALVKDLPDGEHELIVQAPGYQPLTTRVTVKDGRGSAEAKLVAVKGAVAITARAGTVVTAVDANGRETRVGIVPASGTLTSDNVLTIGIYFFKLSHPECAETQQGDVELTHGRTVKLTPAQTALPGELRIFSVPTGAEVSVNGQKKGATPATLREQPSETALAVEVFARGFRRSTQTVTLKPKEVRTLNVGTLAAESGGIALRMTNAQLPMTNVGVTIDGKAIEAAASRSAHLKPGATDTLVFEGLEVGTRAVEVAHPDYEPWRQRVTVRDEQTTAVEVKLVPRPGRLAIRAEPREIALTMNGRAVRAEEISNGELDVPAGEAVALVASAKGYKSAARSFTLAANGADSWSFALEKLRGPEQGQVWTIPGLGLALMPIAAGSFVMGEDNSTQRVTLTQAYWLGKTEVTQGEWAAVMGSNPSNFKGENLPVEQVSWEDAMGFCRKLTERERTAGRLPAGLVYTLPTEAQWEYACRAGTTGEYAGELDAMGWYDQNSGSKTHAVGTKRANAWGLHDMHGNVYEWCADWYGDYPGGSVRDPKGAASGSNRVGRGGGWYLPARGCRSAFRGWGGPGGFLGFRLALSVSP